MDCLEFRRKISQDPNATTGEAGEHALHCPECARELEEALRFEKILMKALEIDVPPGIAEQIERTGKPVFQPASWSCSMPRLAMFTSMLLAIPLVAWLVFKSAGMPAFAEGLPKMVLAHIDGEPELLQKRERVDSDRLASLLAEYGAVVIGDVGHVTYAGHCWIRTRTGLHLVLHGAYGPVTVLLMPGEFIVDRQPVNSDYQSGAIIPTAYGSMAVVGYTGETVDHIVRRLDRVVMWGE